MKIAQTTKPIQASTIACSSSATLEQAQLDSLVSTGSTRRTCRGVTWRAKWNLGLTVNRAEDWQGKMSKGKQELHVEGRHGSGVALLRPYERTVCDDVCRACWAAEFAGLLTDLLLCQRPHLLQRHTFCVVVLVLRHAGLPRSTSRMKTAMLRVGRHVTTDLDVRQSTLEQLQQHVHRHQR